MIFFFIMMIDYDGQFEGQQSAILYRDAKSCGEAITVVANTMKDIPIKMIRCVPTDIPSGSIKPKGRSD